MPFMLMHQALKLAEVSVYGRGGDVGPQIERISEIGRGLNINPCHILRTPGGIDKPGWHLILRQFMDGLNYAEGAMLAKRNTGVMVPTRDCPTLIVENRKTGAVGAAHISRDSVFNRRGCGGGTIEKLLSACAVLDCGEHIFGYIVCGISSEHFEHDDLDYVKPFIEKFGPDVVTDHERGTLDMAAVIVATCAHYGIPEDHISTDGLCTYEDNRLGSLRGGKAEQNWIFVRKI